MDQPVKQRLHPAALVLVEDLRERRECQRYPLCTSIFGSIDHVDAEPFVDTVGRPAAAPRHVQGDIATAARGGVPVEALHPPGFVSRDDQLYPRIPALERAVQIHAESAIGV